MYTHWRMLSKAFFIIDGQVLHDAILSGQCIAIGMMAGQCTPKPTL